MYIKVKLMIPDVDTQLDVIKKKLDSLNLDKPVAVTIDGSICAAYIVDYEER